MLTVVRDPANTAAWASDTRSAQGQFIRQTLKPATGQPPPRIVFVVDDSRTMAPHLAGITEALREVAAGTEALVVAASDSADLLSKSGTNRVGGEPAAAALQRVKPQGGQDNVPALQRAWPLAAMKTNSVLVWIHAPQPVLLDSADTLRQMLERAATGSPHIYELQVEAGPDRILEQFDGLTRVHSVLRKGEVTADLKGLIQSLCRGDQGWKITRTAVGSEAAAREGGATETGLHVARLWALEEIRRLRGLRKFDQAVQLAAKYQLVTPVSGAVVLENQQQFERAGLEPVDPQSVPAIPEPASGTLLVVGLAAFWLCRRRRAGSLPA